MITIDTIDTNPDGAIKIGLVLDPDTCGRDEYYIINTSRVGTATSRIDNTFIPYVSDTVQDTVQVVAGTILHIVVVDCTIRTTISIVVAGTIHIKESIG